MGYGRNILQIVEDRPGGAAPRQYCTGKSTEVQWVKSLVALRYNKEQ